MIKKAIYLAASLLATLMAFLAGTVFTAWFFSVERGDIGAITGGAICAIGMMFFIVVLFGMALKESEIHGR